MTVSGAPRGVAGAFEPGSVAVLQACERLEQERRARAAQLVLVEREVDIGSDEAAGRRDMLRRTLAEIEAALARVNTGTYGICQDCREPIAHDRLEILPYARCCVPCQHRRQPTER
ncbi:molecular chaperone DnaK [Actinomadura rudentiformis]|uniref:Molecular chaperone DnaK n=1 Tax=Actinomadura rudentiformis TaxID=359158 RepID=A0A6H9YQR9_9ACTN|nr:molecular chaperone DnaK [Actinomadura rudentiformis]